MKLSEQFVRSTANEVLMLLGNETKDRCDTINNEILCRLEKSCEEEIPVAEKCTVKGSTHYVGKIPASCYSGVSRDEGYIIVDAALKQFQKKFEDRIPDVVIIEQESEIQRYYRF